jgi:hypothetical protein
MWVSFSSLMAGVFDIVEPEEPNFHVNEETSSNPMCRF